MPAKHTPGPWRVKTVGSCGDGYGLNVQPEADSRGPICDMYSTASDRTVLPMPNAEANARLIAEAPAMLAAIEAAIEYWDCPYKPVYLEAMKEIVARISEPAETETPRVS